MRAEANKPHRAERDAAWKRNVKEYGEAVAGFISVAITHKKNGTYNYTTEDGEKGKKWQPEKYKDKLAAVNVSRNELGFF